MHWTSEARCQGLHDDLWFPPLFKEERTAPESHYYEIAKMVCEQCPVTEKCLKLGIEEEYGVWGGTSPKERRTGEYKRARKLLPDNGVIPPHVPDTRVDVPSLKEALKAHTKRRPRVIEIA